LGLSGGTGDWRAGCVLLAAALTAGPGPAAEVTPPVAPAPPAATAVPAETSAPGLPPDPPSATIEPLYVRPLLAVESGRNDSNPVWSPSGALIAVERSRGDKKEIVVAGLDGTLIQTIYQQLSEDAKEPKFFFPGVLDDTSYNAGITWSPAGDRLVFMSNGGAGNYDLYMRDFGGKTVRLTDHREKDGQAHWSPVAEHLIFVSGRTGTGDVHLLDLTTRALTRLTTGNRPYLYPQWSPDGKKIAMIHGSNENHDIYLIEDMGRPAETLRALTTWANDDLRPVWSPDGKKMAFYSNYNPAGDPRVWSIIVIAADGSDPAQGDRLADKVVATDVIPDVERGPAWMPDSARIVYVKNDRHEFNPIYVADLARKTNLPLKTETKMNHDVACSSQGLIAFRAQVEQWDQVFVAKPKD
jgi:Tol biopolymer transport system component